MQLLLLSSSREGQSGYLEHALPLIQIHLGSIQQVVFIPYAGVTLGWDDYTTRVQEAFGNIQVQGIHQTEDPIKAVKNAQGIVIGGGNTFALLHHLYQQQLISAIIDRVKAGVPYIGWSAGSNIAGNSIRTTNDMPIIQPPSFQALNLVPFQINPHYSDFQPSGHNGETRAQRLEEFMRIEPTMPTIAIREGSALQRIGNELTLLGNQDGIIFLGGEQHIIKPAADLSQWLTNQ